MIGQAHLIVYTTFNITSYINNTSYLESPLYEHMEDPIQLPYGTKKFYMEFNFMVSDRNVKLKSINCWKSILLP